MAERPPGAPNPTRDPLLGEVFPTSRAIIASGEAGGPGTLEAECRHSDGGSGHCQEPEAALLHPPARALPGLSSAGTVDQA